MKTFLRRLEILNFLRSQHRHVATEEIIQHLVDAGYVDNESGVEKSRFRLIQRDLTFLLGNEVEEGEFENEFGLNREQGNRKSLHWQLEPYQVLNYDFERMPAFMALALSVTQKHLRQVLPQGIQQELQRLFAGAERKLHQREQTLSPIHYERLSRSVEFFQRGQKLAAPYFDMAMLDTIYRAILKAKRLRFDYQGVQGLKSYDLHPFGVAIMLPKIYLIGIKDEDIIDHDEQAYRSFLIHKIASIELSPLSNQVPDDFNLKAYLEAGHMDVLLDRRDTEHYPLVLTIHADPHSNLINDLAESPISEDQSLEPLSDVHYKLTATVRRTVQLRNWLLALGPQVKVLSPPFLRQDLLDYLAQTQAQYND